MKNLNRVLDGDFGTIIFAIVVPIAYYFAFDHLPLDGFRGVVLLAGVGAVLGAVLGALFPRVFGYVFYLFFDI